MPADQADDGLLPSASVLYDRSTDAQHAWMTFLPKSIAARLGVPCPDKHGFTTEDACPGQGKSWVGDPAARRSREYYDGAHEAHRAVADRT